VSRVTDVRVLLGEAREAARARLLRTLLPGTVPLLALAVLAATSPRTWPLTIPLALLAASVLAIALLGHRGHASVRGSGEDGDAATVIVRPCGEFWASSAAVGSLSLLVLGLLLVGVLDNPVSFLVGLVAIGGLAIQPVAALTGHQVPGNLTLDPEGVRYRRRSARVAVEWDAVREVRVDESLGELRLIVDRWVPGSRPLEDFEDGAREVVLRLRGWGVLPTDVARLVLHYAAHPEDRAELADSEAVTARLRHQSLTPVVRRRAVWAVGEDSGLEDVRRLDLDPWVPVWRATGSDVTRRALLGYHSVRALGLLCVLGVVVGGGALRGYVGPGPLGIAALLGVVTAVLSGTALLYVSGEDRRVIGRPLVTESKDGVTRATLGRARLRSWLAAVSGLGFAVSAAVTTFRFVGQWPVLAVVGGAVLTLVLLAPLLVTLTGWSAGQLVIDDAGFTYRTGWRAVRVPWTQLVRADAMWGSVVRVERRDGPPLRIDLREMATNISAVVGFLDECARNGRARRIRDVDALYHRLTRRWGP
jgi:hypothetical protein